MSDNPEPKTWDIWFAVVGYEDRDEYKERPVLVIDATHVIVLSLKITSHEPRKKNPGDYQIKMWKEAGLSKPSVIRVGSRLSLSREAFIDKIGVLQEYDKKEVRRLLFEYL